jgi:nucleoside-diphosphate-sugar epimerase
MKLQGTHAFVTGGSGFTGGHLCAALVRQGARVTALVRKTSSTAALQQLGARLVVGDLRERASFDAALSGCDTVYHVAAAFREAKIPDAEYTAINVGGTRSLIEAAAAQGVRRFVHCSTVGVHGDTGREPANEDTPFDPPDFYCQSKVEGEMLARELFARLGLEGVVFRPFGIYGPGDTRFLKLFKGIARGRFVMIGSGEILYQFSYIEDLCDGILLCGTEPEAAGEVFILGGEPPLTLNQILDEVRRATGGKPPRLRIPMAPVMAAATICEKVCRPLGIEPPLYPRRVEFFSKHRAFDISKAKRVLGYAPRVPLAEGFAITAAWYREQGLL